MEPNSHQLRNNQCQQPKRNERVTSGSTTHSSTPRRGFSTRSIARSSRDSQRDGRRAYGAIAEEIGLSEAAVRRRVQRLKDSGVMQIVAITDPLQLGYGREALIGIRVHGDVRLVADKVAAIDEANYVVMTAGSFDIIAEVIAEDDNDLVHLLNDSIRSIPGVTEVETFLYLKLAKQTYAWGEK